MQIYLPIAEISINILAVLALGGITGILSGMFGIGGGFLTTPILMFMGVPPSVSVASAANQIVAASLTGFRAHWRRQNVDFKMGNLLLVGGLIGSTLGVSIFKKLAQLGQIDLVISLAYVLFLGTIGTLMAVESSRSIFHRKSEEAKPILPRALKDHPLLKRLPIRTQFPQSQIETSVLLPIIIGFMVGIMVPIMGVGGGFFMIPAMIYILGMSTSVVIGTSLYQVIFITANVTFLHAVRTQTVDIVLAVLLLLGSVIGAQYGTKIASKLPADKLRGLMSLLVLTLAIKLAYGLFVTPPDIYQVMIPEL